MWPLAILKHIYYTSTNRANFKRLKSNRPGPHRGQIGILKLKHYIISKSLDVTETWKWRLFKSRGHCEVKYLGLPHHFCIVGVSSFNLICIKAKVKTWQFWGHKVRFNKRSLEVTVEVANILFTSADSFPKVSKILYMAQMVLPD